ncbi:hypothetical protein SHEEN_39 [Mycobacterium phage Sheen]|uniref:Uncharacterized protein n=1 Tax=Mycobacterium phage Sheen TaxID=1589274 RepID=A0A0B4ZYE7_9CAUD|nr:hypothetical protein AVV31_gp55 [Mycobacterium phage Sheen]AJD82457.1 hypothetical protein SHEEN_39 [Mycobacterium phage Sheen]
MKRGDKVRIERDEARYPIRGTWRRFRGKRGHFVTRNGDEYGVSFSKDDIVDAWFKRHELVVL